MNYTFLGRSGLKVSRLCLGTMNFGPLTEEKDAFRIMDEALDSGINFFDTANMYGSLTEEGHAGWTEEIIGRWFKQGGHRRERVVLATKLYMRMDEPDDGPNDSDGLSAYKIGRNLEASLKRLQTDHIELYQMHRAERRTSWNELWGAFELAVNQGKIIYVGSSNFQAYDLGKAQWAAERRNFLGMVSEQHLYNLLFRGAEAELLPAAQELGVGLICWSPLAGGFLGGNALNAKQGTRKALRPVDEETRKKIEKYEKLCAEMGMEGGALALGWLMHQKGVVCPIIGPRTSEHLKKSLPACDIKLDEGILQKLDEIFPAVGPIPEGAIVR